MSMLKMDTNKAKVCFISANYGNYEATCKKPAKQTISTDFIYFTDNANIPSNGWIIDTTPYHILNKSPIDTDTYRNSICNNSHTFNIAKYYKQAFQNIPRLKDYDVIIWLDSTLEIIHEGLSEWMLNTIYKHKIIGWEHELRDGDVRDEVNASGFFRYTSTYWNNQSQPYQDIWHQWAEYLNSGYDESFFKKLEPNRSHFGLWLTCFVAFLNNDTKVTEFLDMWYLQTLVHTTQDQISFPYVCQKTNLIPYTLPDNDIEGAHPHLRTAFYIKYEHGL